jgi:hypothetical protein
VLDQPYKGTHRHRPPLGWHPTRKEPKTRDAGPDALSGEATRPYVPIFTGDFPAQPDPVRQQAAEPEPVVAAEAASGPFSAPAQPVAYQYLKRWTFVLVVAGVWIVAAAAGLGLYYWWFHSLDKTPSVFVVLIFLMVCGVGSLLTAMVNKPVVSALAIALMSAPFAATGAAAVLHGLYFCDRVSRCLVGVIPY